MADIITYPENGITYDADDASGYLATRLSGVYSADEDFAVTANGGLTVTVSAGQAWVRPARFRGRSIIMEQPETVTLTAADTVRSRIDRLVLRYDAAAKKTSLTVLTGTPDSASPTAPEITRTALVYDLCLADIRRPAGSTVITAADITDTRTDEDVCGIMRDSVTGIPTAQLLEQWQAAQAQQDAEARQAAAEMLRTAQEQITAQLDSLQQQADQLQTAIDNVESGSFYTKAEVDALVRPYTLPAATTTTLGGVKVGDNLTIDANGRLSGAAPYALPAATAYRLGGVKVGSGLSVTIDGTLSADAQEYSLPTASYYTLGGVKVGDNLTIDANGRLSGAAPYALPAATAYRLGGVKVGDNLSIDASGRLSGAAPYTLPAATASALGGVKVGSGLSVTIDGTLSADAQEYSLPTASYYTLGGIRIGSNLSMDSYGRVSAPDPYTLTKTDIIDKMGYTPAQVTAGTYDLTAGSSYLATGALYVQYATGTSDEAVDDTDIHMPEDESAQDGEPAEADEEVQA